MGLGLSVVQAVDDVMANMLFLEAAYRSGERVYVDHYRNIIGRGRNFFCCVIDFEICFGPSRFIGYRESSFHSEEVKRGAGGETDKVLDQLLGQRASDDRLKHYYERFCDSRGVKPTAHQKTFWLSADAKKRIETDMLEAAVVREKIPETQKLQLISARVGQGLFRERVSALWGNRCALTGCSIGEVLRASHIKPWSVSDNCERLDRYNGLLLAAHVDTLFDRGLLTFEDDGRICLSKNISAEELSKLGILHSDKRIAVHQQHAIYLSYHRKHVFRG